MPPPPPMQRNVAQRQASAPVASSIGAASFAAPSFNRGFSAAVSSANPESSALSSDSDEEESQAPVPPPLPLQPQRVRKRQATHFDSNTLSTDC